LAILLLILILIAETNYIRNPNRNSPYRSDQFLQDGISKHWYETGELKTLEVFSLGNGSAFWFDKRGMLESVGGFGPSPFGLMGPSFDYHPNGFLNGSWREWEDYLLTYLVLNL
jgi:antitoxin component YwqK of YwqJK toxin-antitoxin module